MQNIRVVQRLIEQVIILESVFVVLSKRCYIMIMIKGSMVFVHPSPSPNRQLSGMKILDTRYNSVFKLQIYRISDYHPGIAAAQEYLLNNVAVATPHGHCN